MAAPFFLDSPIQLLFFGGKGGVGKTTCATATAIKLARESPENSFLLVSTDPAHSLADSLADFSFSSSNLQILELNAQECLDAFKKKHDGHLREIAMRGTLFDDEDTSQFLDLSLPGLDELMAFLEIARWIDEKLYDHVVVDTAPTGHTLRLLDMPKLVRKWLEALDALLAKNRYMKQLFKGSYDLDELDQFLLELSGSVKRMETILQDQNRCRFVPVMIAEILSCQETLTLLEELKHAQIPVTDIVVNNLYPERTCPACLNRRAHQIQVLGKFSEKLSGYSLWGIASHAEEIRGKEPLSTFWDSILPLDIRQLSFATSQSFYQDSQVEAPGNLPPAQTELLLFGGKGGVGKTTMACATALRMTQDVPGKNVFLFSMDPAHSLSDCLGLQIGSNPTPVTDRLTAVEIDVQAEFETFKKQYAEEIEYYFNVITPNLDMTFDREVMERIMDLSPSGLDEVMGLTMAIKFLAEKQYDVFIFDLAPTGHLIRLLETPELIEEWLKSIFNLFIKYKQIFRLPDITKRLVQMSKNVKQIQALFKDNARTKLYVVSILTEMAFQETIDLVSACEQRLGINVPLFILNLATPLGNCPFCSARFKLEVEIKKKFKKTFAEKHQILVYRQTEPRGLQQLGKLGEALYLPARNQQISDT